MLPADLTRALDRDALLDQSVLPAQVDDKVESRYVSLKNTVTKGGDRTLSIIECYLFPQSTLL